MEIKFIAYLLAGSLVTFIHDIFDIGDGLMIIALLFWWRMLVAFFAIRRAERNDER